MQPEIKKHGSFLLATEPDSTVNKFGIVCVQRLENRTQIDYLYAPGDKCHTARWYDITDKMHEQLVANMHADIPSYLIKGQLPLA